MDLDTLAYQTSELVNESRALINRIAATGGYTERKKVACNTYRVIDDAKLALERANLLIGWIEGAPRLHRRAPIVNGTSFVSGDKKETRNAKRVARAGGGMPSVPAMSFKAGDI